MSKIDLRNYDELLSIQKNREDDVEVSSSSEGLLKDFVIKEREEELKRITESRYKPEDLPNDYFFSVLGELVLSCD